MKRGMWALVVLVAMTATTALADVLVVTKSGYWWLVQDATGGAVLKKIDRVIQMDSPTMPTDPPADPTKEAAHRASVTEATKAVTDPNKANQKKALAELYRTVAGLPVANRDQLVQATDTLFQALNLQAWAAWKIAVDKSLAGFVSLDAAKRAWVVVSEVLAQ